MIFRDNCVFSGAGDVLFLNEQYSDLTLVVRCGISETRFPVHSLFLMSISKVLRAMLTSCLQEGTTRKVIIEDSNPTAIKQFLSFLYTGEVKLSEWREFADLLYLAHKYQIDVLITLCEEQLVTYISFANVCCLHEIAQLYCLKTLLSECQKLINDGGFVILKTESFRNMSKESVQYFISNRALNVEDESFVLESLRLWAEAECCRRCKELTFANVLEIMKPLLHGVDLKRIPDEKKSFLPASAVKDHHGNDIGRVGFFVPTTLQKHVVSLRFVVELGAFVNRLSPAEPLVFVRFAVDDDVYLVGFRIVGMFRTNVNFGITGPQLILSREDDKSSFAHFNLNSIPWKCGTSSGDYMWKEMVAFFSQPAKIAVNSVYSLTLSCANVLAARWPKTRLDSKAISTVLGKINFVCLGDCTAVTELFLLPAPHDREIPAVSSAC